MAKKNLINIHVETLPNGYSLTVDGQRYMYFNVDELIAAFFIHIAVGKTDYLDREMVNAILLAAASWKTVGEALEANAKLIAAAREAQSEVKAALRGQTAANERAEKAEKDYNRLCNENIELKHKLLQLEDLHRTIADPHHHESSVVLEKPEKKSRGRQILITGKKRYARKD